MEMTADINKNTVDFAPNFDETEKEPTVLPARFPNLLVNGTSGIAVGMATNIPPHNLREIIGAVVKIIDDQIDENGETSIDDILKIVRIFQPEQRFSEQEELKKHTAQDAVRSVCVRLPILNQWQTVRTGLS